MIRRALHLGCWTDLGAKWLMRAFIALGLLSFPALIAQAAFEDTGTGARPTALAGTYASQADDVLSLMYNPAGLARLEEKELTSEYSRLYAGLSDGSNLSQYFLGYGQPIRTGGTLALGWKQFSLDDLYKERTFALGYGEWVTSRVAAGFTLKQLHLSYGVPSMSVDDAGNITGGAPSLFARNGASKTTYSADLGTLVKLRETTTLGIALQDINQPNIALSPDDEDVVPLTIRTAISQALPRRLTLGLGLTVRESQPGSKDQTWAASAEKWWATDTFGDLGLRGSYAHGSRQFRQMVMGAGYRFSRIQLDYAFIFNITGVGLGDTMGTHRFSMSFRFGAPKSAEEKTLADDKNLKKKKKKGMQDSLLYELAAAAEQEKDKPAAEPTKPEHKTESTAKTAELVAEEKVVVTKTAAAPAASPLTAGEAFVEDGLPNTTPAAVTVSTTPMLVVPVAVVRAQPTPAPAAVSVADIELPLVTDASAAVGAPIVSREGLLAELSTLLTAYRQEASVGRTTDERLAALEPVFSVLYRYFDGAQHDTVVQMALSDSLDDAVRDYGRLRANGASEKERLDALTRTLETFLENAMRKRTWNMADARERRYKSWLRKAWNREHLLVATQATASRRLAYLQALVQQALLLERAPAAPVAKPVKPKKVKAPVVAPPAPVKAPVKVKAPAPARPTATPLSAAEARYRMALRTYAQMLRSGARANARMSFLEKVLKDCEKAGLECSEAYEEFEASYYEVMRGLRAGGR
jgi:hypothetical protein